MTSENPLPINRDEALERVDGDDDFLQELLGLYHDEFAKRFDALERAVASNNFAVIWEAGHGLKGASANLSLPGLQAAAFDMEAAGRERNADRAAKTLDRLRTEYDRLKAYLGTP